MESLAERQRLAFDFHGRSSEFPDSIRRTIWRNREFCSSVPASLAGSTKRLIDHARRKRDAWEHVKANIFQAIAAKTDKGEPCCQWVARGGAGHFVKMFHNGIEHGDMQMLCETYVERVSPDIGGMKEMLSSNRRRFDYFVAALGFKM